LVTLKRIIKRGFIEAVTLQLQRLIEAEMQSSSMNPPRIRKLALTPK